MTTKSSPALSFAVLMAAAWYHLLSSSLMLPVEAAYWDNGQSCQTMKLPSREEEVCGSASGQTPSPSYDENGDFAGYAGSFSFSYDYVGKYNGVSVTIQWPYQVTSGYEERPTSGCKVTVNDKKCNTCMECESGGYKADCTNVPEGRNVNRCEGGDGDDAYDGDLFFLPIKSRQFSGTTMLEKRKNCVRKLKNKCNCNAGKLRLQKCMSRTIKNLCASSLTRRAKRQARSTFLASCNSN